MDLTTSLPAINLILDFVLVAASFWMVIAVRGIGGIFGRTLNLIVAGAIILGIGHLFSDFTLGILKWSGDFNNFVHRLVILVGFVVLIIGFRQLSEIKK
jgi:hypothetical protein